MRYPSTTIIKHAYVLAKVNKSPWGRLQNMTPHDSYSIIIQVPTITLVEISQNKRSKIPKIKQT